MEKETETRDVKQSLEKILDLALGIARELRAALEEPAALNASSVGIEPRRGAPDEGEVKHLQV